jgi:hypothetical protein
MTSYLEVGQKVYNDIARVVHGKCAYATNHNDFVVITDHCYCKEQGLPAASSLRLRRMGTYGPFYLLYPDGRIVKYIGRNKIEVRDLEEYRSALSELKEEFLD